MSLPIVFVPLDVDSADKARALVTQLPAHLCGLKIGKELFTETGPDLVREFKSKGHAIFLDLKFHDIPNTVAKAVASACRLEVDMLTIHAAGGAKMIRAAADAITQYPGKKPLLLAVTVLTSMDTADLASIGVETALDKQVANLALLAQQNGATGIVCSAQEAQALRKILDPKIALVTPGIRMPGDAHGDQARVMTPIEAIKAGAKHLVIGRPITQAVEPARALDTILKSLA